MGDGACSLSFYRERDDGSQTGSKERPSTGPTHEVNGILDWFTGLNGAEAICYAFGCVPSDIDIIYWSNTEDDIRTKIKLVLGIERARATENFQALAYVVSAALGGKKNSAPIENEAQAVARFAGIFGNNAVSQTGDIDPFKGLDETFEKLDK